MLRSTPLKAALAVVVLVAMACSAQATAVPVPDANSVNTMIAQTVAAALTQTGLPAGTSTFTPEPTLSPTPSLSPTPLFTATPAVPLISVSVDTNCRVGPGKIYDRVGALLVGETAEVAGIDPTGRYWYIRNPDQPGGFCWLWGEYATLAGNTGALPIFTPPPTPTPLPSFDIAGTNVETCAPNWWVDFKFKNDGGLAFRSLSITLLDTTNNATVALVSNGFTDRDGCLNVSTRDRLSPGAVYVASSPNFAYDPTGHKMRATLTLCSETGLNGTCVTRVYEFKP